MPRSYAQNATRLKVIHLTNLINMLLVLAIGLFLGGILSSLYWLRQYREWKKIYNGLYMEYVSLKKRVTPHDF